MSSSPRRDELGALQTSLNSTGIRLLALEKKYRSSIGFNFSKFWHFLIQMPQEASVLGTSEEQNYTPSLGRFPMASSEAPPGTWKPFLPCPAPSLGMRQAPGTLAALGRRSRETEAEGGRVGPGPNLREKQEKRASYVLAPAVTHYSRREQRVWLIGRTVPLTNKEDIVLLL